MAAQHPHQAHEPIGGPSAFDLLHRSIQRQIWRFGWTHLRPLQQQAIHAILGREGHVILSAGTAAGKTEAAFLPVLSRIADEPTGAVRAMYVGPLKALINDQFRRVEELCGYLEMPVHRWHGDVAAGPKKKLTERPGGVLLITPESLESLFVNRSDRLHGLFAGLRFVVIDELHSFLDSSRGLHLRSLLSRVRLLNAEASAPRLIGLSATIGDHSVAQKYLDADRADEVLVVRGDDGDKEIRVRLHAYRETPRLASAGPSPSAADDDESWQDVQLRTAADLLRHTSGTANLVFANAKGHVEELADLCNGLAERRQAGRPFRVHHGSLSAQIREDTEQDLKEGLPITTFCSSTLEMGIDIGSVRMVGQVGPPASVSSTRQRLGRSGRKPTDPYILRLYIQCRAVDASDGILERLHLNLIQAIAVVELMLVDRWIEPPAPPQYDLSTLTQQTISVIAETGGIGAATLYERLCRRGAFREVDASLFSKLLRNLGRQDVIEQFHDGSLILGLRGEAIRRDKGFYAVFSTPDEWTVLHEGEVLGTLEIIPEQGQHLLFAGRRWLVVETDDQRRVIHVRPARGRKRPRFAGEGGEIHERVRQKMLEVLESDAVPAYLDTEARSLLADARASAADCNLCHLRWLGTGPRECLLLTWTGTRQQRLLLALLQVLGFDACDGEVAIRFRGMSIEEAQHRLAEALRNLPDPIAVAGAVGQSRRGKYDYLLDGELLNEANCREQIPSPETLSALCRLLPVG